jgi:GntP family gluconate:H+ symporter
MTLSLPKKLDEKVFSPTWWIGDAVRIAVPIILITGAGGVFGAMLQNSGMADFI